MKEVWRSVVGFEGNYEVSNKGRVKSKERFTTFSDGRRRKFPSKVLKPKPPGTSIYPEVSLKTNGKCKTAYVHILVLEAFVGPRPKGMQACHNDGNPRNNFLVNLRWDTTKRNHADKKKHGTYRFGETHSQARIKESDVLFIRENCKKRGDIARMARMFGLSRSHTRDIARGLRWKHLNEPVNELGDLRS